jgi:hypothetical protein
MASRTGQIVVKQGSLRPWLIFLDEPDPASPLRRRPVNLALLTAATLAFRPSPLPSTATPRGGACTVADAAGGVLRFAPGPEDVDVAREYGGVLTLTWDPASGAPSPEIVPNRGYLGIVVEPV